MPRLRTRPSLFAGKTAASTTNGVSKNVSNDALFGRSTSNNSFKLDSFKSGIKSTQQLSIDFSKFESHTFFSSARSKTDVAFYKILNQFPYTGSLSDIDDFLNSLTGFEKYVYDSYPKNVGYLFFSGWTGGYQQGTYINVSPIAGKNFPDAPGATGQDKLDLSSSPFEIETQIYVPSIANDNQIIAQRMGTGASFTLALSHSISTDSCKLLFLVSSASDSYLVASGTINKGQFSHIRARLDTEDDGKRSLIYDNNVLIASSSDIQDFEILTFGTQSLTIGSGSRHTIIDYDFEPVQTLSGALDEFRLYRGDRPQPEIDAYSNSQTYGSTGLLLYFRFDEPSGSYNLNNVALDQSGKCLHSYIQNYNQALRTTSSISNEMMQSSAQYSPILFADHSEVTSLFQTLISSASSYDVINPNIIFDLIPRHILVESANAAGLSSYDAGLGLPPAQESVPGTGNIAETSALVKMLNVISIPMDEIKQFADSMSSLLSIELGDTESVSDQMIPFVADYLGVDLPNFFAKSSTNQFSFNGAYDDSQVNSLALKSIRSLLWRRILANTPYVNSSKGTLAAIRSIFLSSGIVPENFFIIRELGQSGDTVIDDKKEQIIEVKSILDFSGSLDKQLGLLPVDANGFATVSPRIVGSYLSASRSEIGFPKQIGGFVNASTYPPRGISNNSSDGLMTSGSFSFEASYVFDKRLAHPKKQSLVRFLVTGSNATHPLTWLNIVYNQNNNITGSLTCSFITTTSTSPEQSNLILTGVNLLDGERWHVSFDKVRGDALGLTNSGSYTLRCAQQVGSITTLFTTSSHVFETTTNIMSNASSTSNASGSYVVIGSQSIPPSTIFLNGKSSDYTFTNFTGKVSNIRFWSTNIDSISFIEHARNSSNIGTNDPEKGLGFDLVQTGAFQRIRFDVNCDQATTASDGSGNIRLFDFSQNALHFSGSGFEPNKSVIKPYRLITSRLSPRFDLQQVNNKVRIRGLNQVLETDPDYTVQGPAHEIYDTDEIVDDVRFAIEHSVVKALDDDIMSTVGNPQYIDDALGNSVLNFSDNYFRFDHLNSIYFNRLTDNVDVMRTYDIFRWVDTALSSMIEQTLSTRTKFLGIIYVVEPHILERSKMRYYYEESSLRSMGISLSYRINEVDTFES